MRVPPREHKPPFYAKISWTRKARAAGQVPYPAMLYSAVTTDACPATERSWVQIPHGTATVSGERAPVLDCLPASLEDSAGLQSATASIATREGEGASSRSASQETW